MSVAKLVWSARWVKWITEEDKRSDLISAIRTGCDLGSDAPSHRLASNHDPIPFQTFMLLRGFYNGEIAGLKFRFWIRHAAALLQIDKVKSHRIQTAFRKPTGE